MRSARPQPRDLPPAGRGLSTALRGFTLVEMLCVVTILGIATAVVAPLLSNTADVRLAAAQRAVLSDLQYAQGLAVSSRTSVYVRCAADRYEVCTLVGPTLTPVAHPTRPGTFVVRFGAAAADRTLRDVALAEPAFGSGDRTLGFDAAGIPFSYSEATGVKSSLATRSELRLGASGVTRLVYVEAFTGELRVP